MKDSDVTRLGCFALGVFLFFFSIAIGLSEGDVEGYIYIGAALLLICFWAARNVNN